MPALVRVSHLTMNSCHPSPFSAADPTADRVGRPLGTPSLALARRPRPDGPASPTSRPVRAGSTATCRTDELRITAAT